MKSDIILKKISRFLFNTFLLLPATFFLIVGFQWIVSPENGASALVMPLLTGAGLNSQIADIGGLFLGMGLLVMIALTIRNSNFLISVSLLLSCVAIYRLIAFVLHDSTLTVRLVFIEIVLAIWFALASKIMSKEGVNHD